MMSSIRSLLSIRLFNGNDPSRRRKGERVWGENYQGLLKRVAASLERLEILEQKKLGRRGQDRFMKKDKQWHEKR